MEITWGSFLSDSCVDSFSSSLAGVFNTSEVWHSEGHSFSKPKPGVDENRFLLYVNTTLLPIIEAFRKLIFYNAIETITLKMILMKHTSNELTVASGHNYKKYVPNKWN